MWTLWTFCGFGGILQDVKGQMNGIYYYKTETKHLIMQFLMEIMNYFNKNFLFKRMIEGRIFNNSLFLLKP
jgi:hypothetical protein